MKQQAIIGTNDDIIHGCISASLGFSKLSNHHISNTDYKEKLPTVYIHDMLSETNPALK